MIDIDKAATDAEIIVNGFAVLPCQEGYKVANLNTGWGVAIYRHDGLLIETNMDDIELSIANKVLAEAMAYEKD